MSRCSSVTCLNGNCQGCRNGIQYCNDPRCFPNCPDCSGKSSLKCVSRRDNWDWGLIVSILVLALVAILLLFWFNYSLNKQYMNGDTNDDTTITTTRLQNSQNDTLPERRF